MKKKKIIVSVINDLTTDQRVHKVSTTLQNMGFDVLLIGRKQRKSSPLSERTYSTKRMFLLFEKGVPFYFEYQLHLFLFLLFHKADVLVSNDLDTLAPNYFISKIKNIPIVYDSHEIFTEVPELKNNAFKKNLWLTIEKNIFPKLKHVFTVNNSIANYFSDLYKVPVNVLRNVPFLKKSEIKIPEKNKIFDTDKKIIILQGAGINIDRGAEEMVEAMQYIDVAILVIIGCGDVIPILEKMIVELKLENKVFLMGKIPFEKLQYYTPLADLGLTLDKDTNLNYRFSLPNKIFDYIQAGVPVLATELVEIKKIITEYQIGDCIQNHDPKHIAEKINAIFANELLLKQWKENTKIAAQTLCWENEEKVLKKTYQSFL
ncbi:MAG TPA: glycosyltransferase [Bacteroidia bacterium]|nr:glycosyltransferase [Bacteroidia bacterium]